MSAKLNLIILILIVAAKVPELTAQEDLCLNRTVEVNVTTDDFRLVKGLDSSNFRGKFRGKAVDITSAGYDTGKRRVVLLLDSSGSMQNNWRPEVTMAADIVSAAPPQTSFALLTFSASADKKVDFSNSRQILITELRDLQRKTETEIKGKTALLDAMLDGIAMFGEHKPGDAIFLVSDGGDNSSKTTVKKVIQTLLSSQIRVFVFNLTVSMEARGRTPVEIDGPVTLRHIVEITGGDMFDYPLGQGLASDLETERELEMRAKNPKMISMAASAFAQEFSELYLLHIKLPEPVDKPRKWDIEVIDHDGKKNPHLRIIYPRQLAPCL